MYREKLIAFNKMYKIYPESYLEKLSESKYLFQIEIDPIVDNIENIADMSDQRKIMEGMEEIRRENRELYALLKETHRGISSTQTKLF